MGDQQDQRIKTLRRELEGWREVLVHGYSIMVWEKNFYPAISISVTSFIFLMIWYFDPSVLTLFSLIGVFLTLCDYIIPQVVPMICGTNHWTGNDERRYEQIITSVAGIVGTLSCACNTITSMKTSKPKTYFFSVSGGLLFTAWLGSSVDNMFLAYLIMVFLVLTPGMKKHGIFKKYFATVFDLVSGVLKNFMGPTSQPTESKKKE